MTSTNSTLIFIAMLSVLLNSCASVSPNCAPVSPNYATVSTHYSDIAKNEPEYYRVKKDDTLYAISLLFDLDYRQLAQWNRIAPPYYTIAVGQKIRLSDPIWESKSMQERGTPPRMRSAEQLSRTTSKTGVLGAAVAVADDSRDGGGRATHGAVAETKIGAVTASNKRSMNEAKSRSGGLNK